MMESMLRRLGLVSALAVLASASACSMNVNIPPNVFAGSEVTVTIDITGQGADTATPHSLCIGLADPDNLGWNAVATSWALTAGTGSPASGTPTRDMAAEETAVMTAPEGAPWRCYTVTTPTTSTDSIGNAVVKLTVPPAAVLGDHTIVWNYTNGNAASSVTEIRVAEGTPVAELGDATLNCKGGASVEFGYDSDGDGAADNATGSLYACDDPMFPAIAQIIDEPPGDNCEAGGLKLEVGLDNGDTGGTPSNGLLEAGEVDAFDFLCNRPGTFTTLSGDLDEPAGDNCPLGGIRTDSGLDDGGGDGLPNDGILDAGEIDTTTYTCNEEMKKKGGGGCSSGTGGGLIALLFAAWAMTRRRAVRV
jgi:hypothetical protein